MGTLGINSLKFMKSVKKHLAKTNQKLERYFMRRQESYMWSYHMKSMKQAFGEFPNFHMKWSLV